MQEIIRYFVHSRGRGEDTLAGVSLPPPLNVVLDHRLELNNKKKKKYILQHILLSIKHVDVTSGCDIFWCGITYSCLCIFFLIPLTMKPLNNNLKTKFSENINNQLIYI